MQTTTKDIARAIVEGYRGSFVSTKVDDALAKLCNDLVDAQMSLASKAEFGSGDQHCVVLLCSLAAHIEDLMGDEEPMKFSIISTRHGQIEPLFVNIKDVIEHLSTSLCIPDDDHKTLDAWREQLSEGRPLTTLSGVTYQRVEEV